MIQLDGNITFTLIGDNKSTLIGGQYLRINRTLSIKK